MPAPKFEPRHFYLNERHELPVEKKSAGGPQRPFPDIDWKQKSERLTRSLDQVERRAAASADPSTRGRLFILAEPVGHVVKISTAKDAIEGRKKEAVSFSGEYSKVFDRLGMQLVEVHPDRTATIHALPERLAQLRARASELGPDSSLRQQALWVSIAGFDWVPAEMKFDAAWLKGIGKHRVEAHIKLHPFLSTFDADAVIRAIEEKLRGLAGNELRGKEVSYLGRVWLRAILTAQGIRALAEEFASIQSIHPPIIAHVSASPFRSRSPAAAPLVPNVSDTATSLPCVAIVDTAIPDDHLALARFRRGGPFLGRGCSNVPNDHHGTFVASRVVFGDLDFSSGTGVLPPATCAFHEIRVAEAANTIRAESVPNALSSVTGSAPDVRVFNLSFDTKQPLDAMPPKLRAETMKVMEELDNFAFDQDALLILAAGNVEAGQIPQPRYPQHMDDERWALHAWPRCFNALTCGGIIPRISAAGLGDEPNAPSPFSRFGPGFAGSPKPDFCAPAGNSNANHQSEPGMGVWALSASSEPAEVFGTSHAAPLLAREAAFVLHELRRACSPDVRPFSCTAKAILALTAEDVAAGLGTGYQPLVQRGALGYGRASAGPIREPQIASAMFFWQGFSEHADDIVRVRLPIPRAWLRAASEPALRICVAWDSPVNSSVESWSCRDVSLTVRVSEDSESAHGSHRKGKGYPLVSRKWNLAKASEKTPPPDDVWIAELRYQQIAAYAPGHLPSPVQRLAFAAELRDCGENPISPQAFVQQIPIAATMTRFSVAPVPSRQPITVTSGL